MKRALLLFASLLLLAAANTFAQAQAPPQTPKKVAFLFAVGSPAHDSEGPSEFRTMLLVIEGDRMRLAVSVPGLVVPRKDGFWRVGILPPQPLSAAEAKSLLAKAAARGQRVEIEGGEESPETSLTEEGLWYDWKLWASPLGKEPVLAPREPDEEGELLSGGGVRYLTISWVGSDYVSMTDNYATQGPMLNYVTAPMILPLDAIAKDGYAEFIGGKTWIPAVPENILQRDLENCVDDSDPESFTSREMLESAYQSWSIIRGRIRWIFQWGFNHGSGAARGYNATCPTSARPPAQLVGLDSLAVPWTEVLRRVPDAMTAFSAPDGSLVLVFTRQDVLAFRPIRRALGPATTKLTFGNETIVMGQWALGVYVDRWTAELKRAETLGLPRLKATGQSSWPSVSTPANHRPDGTDINDGAIHNLSKKNDIELANHPRRLP